MKEKRQELLLRQLLMLNRITFSQMTMIIYRIEQTLFLKLNKIHQLTITLEHRTAKINPLKNNNNKEVAIFS
jgi:hypothetical protein